MRASMVSRRDENDVATKQIPVREGVFNINNNAMIPQKKLDVATRKRAVLTDRTNVSFKQNTVSEQTHNIIKPIIKPENVVKLGIPAVKSEKHELFFDPT